MTNFYFHINNICVIFSSLYEIIHDIYKSEKDNTIKIVDVDETYHLKVQKYF